MRIPSLTHAKRLVGSASGYQVAEGVPVDGANATFSSLIRRVQSRKVLVLSIKSNDSEYEGRPLLVT